MTGSTDTSRTMLGLALGLLGVIIFGGTLPATRVALEGFEPIFATALRTAIAGVCAVMLLLIVRRKPPPRELWRMIVLAALGVALGFPMFVALAMQTVPASHGGVVLGILPLATAIAGTLTSHERPGALYWIMAAIGAALVTSFALRNGGGDGLATGDLYLLIAIIAASIGYAYSAKLSAYMPGWEVISWVLVLALPFAAMTAFILSPDNVAAVPLRPWLGIFYLALFSQWIGFFAWNTGLALGGISRVSQVQLLQTFVTLVLAAIVNDEHIDAETMIFAVAVVIIVGLSARARVSHKSQENLS